MHSKSLKTILAGAILLSLAGLGACNTVKGVGQDVKAAGGAVEKTAEDAKK